MIQAVSSKSLYGCMVKSMIVIGDSSSPDRYAFEFDLPNNYKILKGEDYFSSPEAKDGFLYIVDMSNMTVNEATGEKYPESIAFIYPAWAKDADGNDIDTKYEVKGNRIIQTVKFDESSSFPIVADPNIQGYKYQKKNVSYSTKWNSPQKVSANVHAGKGETGTITCSKVITARGSIKGEIKGIITIGVGGAISSEKGYLLSFKGPATKYMAYSTKFKYEYGTRQKIAVYENGTTKVVSSNKYTVKKPIDNKYELKTSN